MACVAKGVYTEQRVPELPYELDNAISTWTSPESTAATWLGKAPGCICCCHVQGKDITKDGTANELLSH